MTAYYNEFDPYAAKWLRNLISAGLIAPGDVDERSIRDVRPEDLRGYTQCHFFAGIGAWSHALRLAGWPDDRPVWTGSCPCQPLSSAGKRKGHADERHLWPAFYGLIAECKPSAVFGEQVASKDGREWFSAVRADLEDAGYACGAADICAAGQGVGWEESQGGEWLRRAIRDCPDPWIADQLRDFADWAGGNLVWGGVHIRQRLWWVADANGGNSGAEWQQCGGEHRQQQDDGTVGSMGHPVGFDRGRETPPPDHGRDEETDRPSNRTGGRGSASGGMANADSQQHDGSRIGGAGRRVEHTDGGATFLVGHPDHNGCEPWGEGQPSSGHGAPFEPVSGVGIMDNTNSVGRKRREPLSGPGSRDIDVRDGAIVGMANSEHGGREAGKSEWRWPSSTLSSSNFGDRPGTHDERRGTADWLFCRDGKWRPVRPGSFPLAHGASARVGRLRAYGNAIDPQVAAEVIGAYLDIERGVK